MATLAANCALLKAQTNNNKEQIYTWINQSCEALKVPLPAVDVLESFTGECLNHLKNGVKPSRVKLDIKEFVKEHRASIARHAAQDARNTLRLETYFVRAWFDRVTTSNVEELDEETKEEMIKQGIFSAGETKKSWPIQRTVRNMIMDLVSSGDDALAIMDRMSKPALIVSIAKLHVGLEFGGEITVSLVRGYIQSALGNALRRGAKTMSNDKAETWDAMLAAFNKTSKLTILPIKDWIKEDKRNVPVFCNMTDLAMPDVQHDALDNRDWELLNKYK